MQAALDLAALTQRLRERGMRVDTRQYLAANELLLALAARGEFIAADPDALIHYLAPIFCCSPEEQQTFASVFRAWYSGEPASPERAKEPSLRRIPRWWIATSLAVILVVLAAVWLLQEVAVAGKVLARTPGGDTIGANGAVVSYAGQQWTLGPDGEFTLNVRRLEEPAQLSVSLEGHTSATLLASARSPQPLLIVLDPVIASESEEQGQIVGTAQLLAQGTFAMPPEVNATTDWPRLVGLALLIAVLTAGYATFRSRRRELAVKRLLRPEPQRSRTLNPPCPPMVDIQLQALRRIAAGLRRVRAERYLELSVVATVESTARAGGFITPAFAPRVATPEYLILIERCTSEDHSARLLHRWFEQLREHGVHAECYDFATDPRVCVAADGQRYRLRQLLARHHRSALLLCTDASHCLDAVSGRPHRWTEWLNALPRRALLTMSPFATWGSSERKVSDSGFIVVPASIHGLQTLAGLGDDWSEQPRLNHHYARAFPRCVAADASRWLDRNAPPTATAASLLTELYQYLGPAGYRWLCACAVYPEISWALTLSLWDAVAQDTSDLARRRAVEEHLPALARLPWFRFGYMPDWLRRLLIASLPRETEAAVRAHLERLLYALLDLPKQRPPWWKRWATKTQSKPSSPDQSSSADTLEVAIDLKPLEIAQASEHDSPLRDTVFLTFLARGDLDPLAVRLGTRAAPAGPQRHGVLEALGSKWRRAAVVRPWLARSIASAAVAMVAFAILWFALPRSEQAVVRPAFEQVYGFGPAVDPNQVRRAFDAVISSDGTLIALVGNGEIQVLDAADYTVRETLPHTLATAETVRSLRFSRDARYLAAIIEGDGPTVWELGNRRVRNYGAVFQQSALSVHFTADTRATIVVSEDGIWTAPIGSGNAPGYVYTSESYEGRVIGFAVSPVSSVAASAHLDSRVRVWDTSDWQQVATIELPQIVAELVFDPEGRYIGALPMIAGGSSGAPSHRIFVLDTQDLTRVDAAYQVTNRFDRGIYDLVLGPSAAFIAYDTGVQPVNLLNRDGRALFSTSFDESTRTAGADNVSSLFTLRLRREASEEVQYEVVRHRFRFAAAAPSMTDSQATIALDPVQSDGQDAVQSPAQQTPATNNDEQTPVQNAVAQENPPPNSTPVDTTQQSPIQQPVPEGSNASNATPGDPPAAPVLMGASIESLLARDDLWFIKGRDLNPTFAVRPAQGQFCCEASRATFSTGNYLVTLDLEYERAGDAQYARRIRVTATVNNELTQNVTFEADTLTGNEQLMSVGPFTFRVELMVRGGSALAGERVFDMRSIVMSVVVDARVPNRPANLQIQ